MPTAWLDGPRSTELGRIYNPHSSALPGSSDNGRWPQAASAAASAGSFDDLARSSVAGYKDFATTVTNLASGGALAWSNHGVESARKTTSSEINNQTPRKYDQVAYRNFDSGLDSKHHQSKDTHSVHKKR